jgi:hypothetical protein
MAAINTLGAVDFSRRLAGVPRRFREPGSVAWIVVFLCRALDSDRRIRYQQSHFIFSPSRVSRLLSQSLFTLMLHGYCARCCPILNILKKNDRPVPNGPPQIGTILDNRDF